MSTTVTMPQLGETVTEGTILRWAKQVGDSVAEDEVLVEISTDKVDTEVPSPAAGTILEILVEEGETVEVGAPLVVIGEAGSATETAPEPAAAEPAAESPAAPAAESPAAPAAAAESESRQAPDEASAEPAAAVAGEGRLLSPVVRKLIRENDLDPARITGTGQGGRITRKDVETFIESGAASAPEPAAPEEPARAEPVPAAPAEPAPSKPEPEPAPAAEAAEPVATAPAPAAEAAKPAAPTPATAAADSEVVELDRLRVRIGQNLIKSKQTAAHVWTSMEVDYERVERVRQRHKEAFKTAEGFSLTYLPFIARATIDALKEFPVVNSEFHLEERQAVFHRTVNLGIAIDLDQKGLVVASIRNADGLRLVGLARQVSALADKARSGKLEPNDVTGSTFTITNPGPFGSFMSAPVINLPNTGILSTDTVAKRPAVITSADGEDVLAIRHIGYLGLTWDHRAFDGSTAVLFLQRIKQNLETWDWEQELT
jgi:pyruvate dehydrogenase E2 component (dihydrolipoamide acetyltransferase)